MQKINILQKKGSKPETIVFIHGNSSSNRIYDSLFGSDLIPYNLISFDLEGHGNSEKNGSYSIEGFKKNILDVLNTINGKFILVGHSFGGHLTLEIADEISELEGIVIFGTPPLKNPINLNEAFLPNPHGATLFTESPSQKEVEAFFEDTVTIKEVIPILQEDFDKSDPKIRSAIALGIATPNAFKDERTVFLGLTINKCIIHGENDSIINLDYIKQIQTDANNSFEIKIVKNSGHYPSLEQPDDFLTLIADFANSTFG
ncbi:alpha/beta fold hydrolase [Chondrinema litorale]|uniref:alpha/beta fold hydrolase n=1 Tax=Chondrinema litorale TaxID=2994555 RepID=UPI00254350C1|nr:alpha/beta hydrolase [Chondrinema litorale]UZR96945.1 alpha/beta hydrolase [Chondrinema litorale]